MEKIKKKFNDLIKKFLRTCGFRIERLDTHNFIEPMLYRRINQASEFFFIQIGANDGVNFDPIFPFVTDNHKKIRGIVVEPLKDVFQELQHNYRNYPQIIKVNAAIHNSEKEMIMYRVDPIANGKLPEWTKGIASFNKDHHKLSPITKGHIIKEKVNCLSLQELIDKYNVKEIDLLQIDTEGYDFEIIDAIDFGRIKPQIIYFEHGLKYGTSNRDDFIKITDLLKKQSYYIIIEPDDAIAYQHKLQDF